MKKHFIVVLSITMCLVLSVGILTACGTETDEPQKHTISFYADTSLVDTIETAGNEEITLPAAPRKEGCTFEGWFFDNGTWENELTKDSFADRALTGDVNAYAYYKENETPVPPSPTEYTITFMPTAASAILWKRRGTKF